jgi:hypothetical protein
MIIERYIGKNVVKDLKQLLKTEKLNRNSTTLTCTVNGFQTKNLCEREEYQYILDHLLSLVSDVFPPFKYRWFHLIDYESGGWQKEHDHTKTEDYSFIVYLDTCTRGGETIFRLPENQLFVSAPIKGKVLFFPSTIPHWGEKTIFRKRVAVGALKYKKQ